MTNNGDKMLPNRALYFLPVLALTGGAVAAAPSIGSVELLADSGEVRVSGTGFGSGPDVVIFDNFEAGRGGEPVVYDSATVGEWGGTGWYNGIARYVDEGNGNLAMTARDRKQSLSSMNRISQLEARFKNSEKVFIAFSVKVPKGTTFAGASSTQDFPSVSSWKFSWALAADGAYSDPSDLDLTLPTHVGGGNFTLGGNDGNITWLDGGGGWWSWNDFNNLSIGIDLSSSSEVSYYWRSVSDRDVRSERSVSDRNKLSADELFLNRVNFPGWWGNGDNSDFNGLYDNTYVAIGENYLARIEIRDGMDDADTTRLIVVPAKSWSSSEIILDSSIVEGLEGSFISIVDASGRASDPVPIVCTKCPSKIRVLEIK
ncbi:MAG: hypothetical protein ABNH34_01930 [Marinobacter sp.]